MPDTSPTYTVEQLVRDSRDPGALVILRSARGVRCSKQILKDADGTVSIVDYPGEAHWYPEVLLCRDIESLANGLRIVMRTGDRIVVHEALRDDLISLPIRRKAHGEEAALQPQDRLWMSMDIDDFVLPERAIHATPKERVRELMTHLPDPFRTSKCFYHYTSKYMIAHPRNVMRVRLWFWLSAPMSARAWKRLMKPLKATLGIDPSFYDATRPYYVAPPIFLGMDDPMPAADRIGGINA